jgi:hypothetical protein
MFDAAPHLGDDRLESRSPGARVGQTFGVLRTMPEIVQEPETAA